MDYRVERDSLGAVRVPLGAYWGVQTQRAVDNFPVSGLKAHPKLRNFDLVRNSRLSIMKVTDEQWEIMEGMATKK